VVLLYIVYKQNKNRLSLVMDVEDYKKLGYKLEMELISSTSYSITIYYHNVKIFYEEYKTNHIKDLNGIFIMECNKDLRDTKIDNLLNDNNG